MAENSRRQKLEAMLEADPTDQMLRYMLAMDLEKEGRTEESLNYLQDLMHDVPPYVPAFLMAGQQLVAVHRINEAATCYRLGIDEARRQGNEHAAGEMREFLQQLEATL